MRTKARLLSGPDGKPQSVAFFCSGCGDNHVVPFTDVPVTKEHPLPPGVWFFNGNLDKPTISPSIRIIGGVTGTLCHVVVTDGILNFCADSPHKYAGQSIGMLPCELISDSDEAA